MSPSDYVILKNPPSFLGEKWGSVRIFFGAAATAGIFPLYVVPDKKPLPTPGGRGRGRGVDQNVHFMIAIFTGSVNVSRCSFFISAKRTLLITSIGRSRALSP